MKISIITISFNAENTIEKTLMSIESQSYYNIEHIIVDGGSKDNTLEICNSFPHVSKIISESDKGIYDAFNKGMSLCRGNFIGIINSDDTYTKNSLKIISSYIKKKPEFDFIFGSVRKHWGVLYGYKPKKIFYSWGFYSSHSTGFFIKRTSAQKVGLYDLKYKYSADRDLIYRLIVTHKLNGMCTKKNEIISKITSYLKDDNKLNKLKEEGLAWSSNYTKEKYAERFIKKVDD